MEVTENMAIAEVIFHQEVLVRDLLAQYKVTSGRQTYNKLNFVQDASIVIR